MTTDDGLSHSTVRAIHQDRRGFLWLACESFLQRYDGYRLVPFKHDPDDPNTLSESQVSVIAEDRAGHLWFGTRGTGVNRFDPMSERFEQFVPVADDPRRLTPGLVTTIEEDVDGSVWVGTTNGLNRLDPASGRVTRYLHLEEGGGPSHDAILDILVDSAGELWVGSFGGLDRLDRDEDRFESVGRAPQTPEDNPFKLFSTLFEDSQGALWVGTWDGLLHRRARPGEAFVTLVPEPDASASGEREITVIAEDGVGDLWIGTAGRGVLRWRRSDGVFERYAHRAGDVRSLGSNKVLDIVEDHSSVLWIVGDAGVARWPRGQRQVGVLRYRPPMVHGADGPTSGLPGPDVMELAEGGDGRLWIGTLADGLVRFDPTTRSFDSPDGLGGMGSAWPHGPVRALLEDDDGTLWIGVGSGLLRFEVGGRPMLVDPLIVGVNTLLEDSQGAIWTGTGIGLYRYDPKTGDIRRFVHDVEVLGARAANRIYDLVEEAPGRIWAASEGGLTRVDVESGALERWRHRSGEAGPSSDNIVFLHLDGDGDLWLGTYGSGLDHWDPVTNRWRNFHERDGLPSDKVVSILEGEDGTLWLGTNGGLAHFDPDTESFRVYGASDGLHGDAFFIGSALRTTEGTLHFGGPGGLSRFQPADLVDDLRPPEVVLTQLWLLDLPVNSSEEAPHSPLDGSITFAHDLVLDHRQATIAFEFAALHYVSPRELRYAYRLAGHDAAWIHTDSEHRLARYTDLSPGSYTFHVRAANPDGVWNEEGASIDILITPPWWQTRIAWGLWALLLVSGGVGVDRFRRRRLIERERERSKRRESKLRTQAAEIEARSLRELNARREQELVKARELARAYEVLERKNQELETLDRIVEAINRELISEDVMRVVLEQGLELIPQASRGAFITSNRHRDHFEVVATSGWEDEQIVGLSMTVSETFGRYTEESEQLDHGIFLVRDLLARPGADKLRHLPPPRPEALLAITVTLGQEVEGFLVFAIFTVLETPDSLDRRTLRRYRHHAISALEKARAYEALRGKNQELEEKSTQILATHTQLIEQTTHLNALIESSPLGIVVLDSEGKIQSCNPAFEELFQYSQDEISGQGLRDILATEETREEVGANIARVRAGEVVHQETARRRCRNGRMLEVELFAVPLMIEGRYGGSFALYRDIGERKRAERAVFEEKERAQVTLDSIGDAVITTDATGIVDYMNPVAESLTGQQSAEAIGRPLTEVFRVVDEKSRRRVADPVTRCLTEKSVVAVSERRVLLAPGGREYPIRDSAAPIRDREGKILGAVLVFKDVTAERRMAQQVIQSEKMASLGQLVAGVAHEINNPVNFISSGLPSLRRNIDKLCQIVPKEARGRPDPVRQRIGKLLEAIEEGAHRTAEIVRNLRTFSRPEESAVKMADLHRALDTTLGLLHNQTKHRIRVEKRYGDLPGVECYLGQLNQVFMNVLVNAAQAIEGEGSITITTARLDQDHVEISIRDTGRGMTEQIRSRVFDPFFSTKPEGQGTGLGLAISHGIMENHGGTITLESEPGQGAEVVLVLPLRLPSKSSEGVGVRGVP